MHKLTSTQKKKNTVKQNCPGSVAFYDIRLENETGSSPNGHRQKKA